jgi:hypothetical protein
MTAARPLFTASQVRKARGNSRCVLCHAAIRTGQQIGKLAPGRWAHTSCIIQANRTTPKE